ncbi:TonB-dependent receptor [Herminiimonas sp.]|uniref:TonB-dependent receptor n=1 Tax=Herminiimonas sp. TaxID=1926289 RepID=UPI00271C97CF|nr:TonB-dependent receptor [Herminiimonas sp.]MDO8306158.1 TonB-dependent receptor [Herminiimonas sp.]
MIAQRTLLASAVLSALASLSHSAFAQAQEQTLPDIVVTSTPFGSAEAAQILAPAKVLYGDELREKLGNSLGDTLSQELGVSASAFGAGASRPIIRGLEGPRVKILQNGMSVMDASSLSNDHAVAGEAATARQIEILRGPAALLYGSGAIGGVVNIVNERIPTVLNAQPTGDAEVRFGSADQMKNMSLSVDGAAGDIGLHVDGNYRDANDYRIPGNVSLSDASLGAGHLPNSYARANSIGLGASYIQSWGHIGASVGVNDDRYGIPTAERSFITLKQTRYDLDGLIREPFDNFESLRFKLGHTDYQHTENLKNGTPATIFKNDALESRLELTHKPLAGWRGTFGLQTENSEFSALGADGSGSKTVPLTKSDTIAGFVVEERDFGPLRASAGARIESVQRKPDATSGLAERDFNLGSYSLGGLWTFTPGYGFGTTASIAQRAPAIEELYSRGPHESTASYDTGDVRLNKETSRNFELSLQKTAGLVRWKANLFKNRVKNFIYGRTDGTKVDEAGIVDPTGEFTQRFWAQNGATIHGAEAELSYNLRGEGWSWRGFADTSRGKLTGAGNLPLQPATRFGAEVAYRQGGWRSGLKALHAQRQDRLASFESFTTPSYTQVDANLSYTQRSATMPITWFAMVKNILNEDIRLSTSVLRASAPLAGRNLIIGVRTSF